MEMQMHPRFDENGDGQGAYPNLHELKRLAKRAQHHGMTLHSLKTRERVDHFVLDPRDHTCNYVSGVSCSCRQFVQSGGVACQHWALLVVETNWIPEAVADVGMDAA